VVSLKYGLIFGAAFLVSAVVVGSLTLLQRGPVSLAAAREIDPHSGASGSQRLAVDSRELDLGAVWAEPAHQHSFRVVNASDKAVVVDRITVSCDCTSVAPASFTLEPGAGQEVTATIDLARASGDAADRTQKPVDSTITFVFDDGRMQSFTLRGTASYPFAAPSSLVFDEAIPVGGVAIPKRFTIWKDHRIAQLNVTVSPADGELTEVASLATATSSTFDLVPAMNRPLGRFEFTVEVEAVAEEDGKRHGPMPVRISGRIGADVKWSPDDVLLIAADSQATAEEDVVLWSESGEPFEILPEIEAPGFVKVSVKEPAAGFQETTRIVHLASTQTPTARLAGTVLLRVKTKGGREFRVPIPVGLQPLIIEDPHFSESTETAQLD